VKRWLKAHPRFHLHFTPTSASWLNMVERFFAEITRNRIRRGAFKSVAELKSAIMPTWTTTMPIQSRSSGPNLQAKSSKRSPVRNKR
jgi:transposase